MRAYSLVAFIGIGILIGLSDLSANPIGAMFVNGTGTIGTTGNRLTITASDYAIMHWNDFSINGGEITNFILPSASSSVLNRVVGPNISNIYGTLSSNGKVFLINPNGIFIGASGVINTASFVASTLDVTNSSFIAGADLTFAGGSTAGITNLGQVTASNGDVIFIANNIVNNGVINANQGTAALAAGSQVLVKANGGPASQRIFVQAGTGGINSQGLISAATVELNAAGGNAYALAINNTGVVNAVAFNNQGGHIFLTAGQGDIQTSKLNAAGNITGNASGNIILSDVVNGSGGIDLNSTNGQITNQGNAQSYLRSNALTLLNGNIVASGALVLNGAQNLSVLGGNLTISPGGNISNSGGGSILYGGGSTVTVISSGPPILTGISTVPITQSPVINFVGEIHQLPSIGPILSIGEISLPVPISRLGNALNTALHIQGNADRVIASHTHILPPVKGYNQLGGFSLLKPIAFVPTGTTSNFTIQTKALAGVSSYSVNN